MSMPTPPGGVVSHLIVDGGDAAIEFYKKAFGATVISRSPDESGKRLMHAELEINGGRIYLSDNYPEYHDGKSQSPKGFGGTPVYLHLNVPNCDEAYKRAVDAGGKGTMGPADMFWGARYAQIQDPFGHMWSFMHLLKK